jgi:2-oxoisovalerate dehydrogenase E1 component beta subunit
MAQITLIEAVTQALAYEMAHDESVVVLGEDVGVNGGVFRATQGLQEKFGELRVLDTPLDETTIAGVTVGLAAQGMKPVAEAQFEGFIYPMMEQIACHAARLRNRTRGRITVPAVWRAPWGGGIRAPEHHSEANEHLFTNIPGLRVVMPSSPARAYGLLLAAIRDPDPVMFFEPKRIYRQYKEEVPDDGEALPLDVCFVLRDGTDVTIVTWGAQVKEALEAADALAEEGISAHPAGFRHHRRIGAENRSLRNRARSAQDRRLRRGNRRASGRGMHVRPGRASRTRHRLRHAYPAVPARDEIPAEHGTCGRSRETRTGSKLT